jgi:predicted nucleic acid-binding protein
MGRVLCFDASVLSPFARAGLLPLLEKATAGGQRVVTRAVLEEIKQGVEAGYPELGRVLRANWLEPVRVDSVRELVIFAELTLRFGRTGRDIGEASTIAWAEANAGTVVADDQVAYNVCRERKVPVERSMRLLAGALRNAILSETDAAAAVDALVDRGARLPVASGAEFLSWYREEPI